MVPNPTGLLKRLDIHTPLIGFYDAPETAPFAPVVTPGRGHVCVFSFYDHWLQGQTLLLAGDNFGCGGASHHLGNRPTRERGEFLEFLVETEGLRESTEMMGRWVDSYRPFRKEHPYLLIGPLKDEQYDYLRTITFLVNPDQLSALVIGANYHFTPGDPAPVLAPWGSGCGELICDFVDLEVPQAAIGMTDLAMRHHVPPDVMAFTVTKPMFERLCALDERSFLGKAFLKNLRKARGADGLGGR